eukprot:COSAG02_NODE_19001_length_906_cov_0.876084_2_plen_26_part_01
MQLISLDYVFVRFSLSQDAKELMYGG